MGQDDAMFAQISQKVAPICIPKNDCIPEQYASEDSDSKAECCDSVNGVRPEVPNQIWPDSKTDMKGCFRRCKSDEDCNDVFGKCFFSTKPGKHGQCMEDGNPPAHVILV